MFFGFLFQKITLYFPGKYTLSSSCQQLTVKASDGSEGEHFSTASVTVNVVRDRSPPVLQGQDKKTISETTPVNASVLTVHASDSDLVVGSLSLVIILIIIKTFL